MRSLTCKQIVLNDTKTTLMAWKRDSSEGPDPLEGLAIGFPLAFADGGEFALLPRRGPSDQTTPGGSVASPLSSGEALNPAVSALLIAAKVPFIVKKLIANYIRWSASPPGRNDAYARMLECMHPCSISEERRLNICREEYRARWVAAMKQQDIDFILTLSHSLPPMPKDGTATATLLAANYCFLYNTVSCNDFCHSVSMLTSVVA